ncbi:21967_t:CDS:2 [Rhizophagus irregularis]|nr:21967_t:CDS:2 [Rhizophagus irregularis]
MRNLELPTDFPTGGKQSLKLPTSFAKWRRIAHTRALPTENEGRGCCKTSSMGNLELPTGFSTGGKQKNEGRGCCKTNSMKNLKLSPNGEGLHTRGRYQQITKVVGVVNNQFYTPKEKALPTSFAKWRRVAHTRALPSENEGRGRVAHTKALPSENEGRGCCKQSVYTPKEKALPTSFAKWRRVAHTRALLSENEGRGCCKQPVHAPKRVRLFPVHF